MVKYFTELLTAKSSSPKNQINSPLAIKDTLSTFRAKPKFFLFFLYLIFSFFLKGLIKFFIFFFEQLSDMQTSKSFLFFCFANEFKQFKRLSGLLYVGIQIDSSIYY